MADDTTNKFRKMLSFFEGIRDERNTAANTASRIGRAFIMLLDYCANGVAGLYLSKTKDDETTHKLTMGEAEVKGALTVGGDISGTTGVRSKNFDGAREDSMEHGKGFGAVEKDGAGKIYTDFLHVRTKAYFEELETRVLSRVGGDYLFTKAGSKIVYVEGHNKAKEVITDSSSDKAVSFYRCYYLQDDGTTQTMNNWSVGDFARCQVTNIKQGVSQHASNRYYTRLVLAVSDAPELISAFGKDETKKYGWVDLAANVSNKGVTVTVGGESFQFDFTDCVDGTDVPAAEDAIVQVGNVFAQDTGGNSKTKGAFKGRGNVLLLSATSGGIYIYNGINAPEKDKMIDFQSQQIDTDRVRFRSDLFQVAPWAAPKDSATLFCLRGDYSAEATYGKGDVVLHGGQLWCCTSDKPVNGIAPDSTDGAKYWVLYTAKGADGKDGQDGKSARRTAVVSVTSDNGTVFNDSYENVILKCNVMIDGKSMGGVIPSCNFMWTRDEEVIWEEGASRFRTASSSDSLDLWKCSVKIPKRLLEPIELTTVRVEGNNLIFRASEDITGREIMFCRRTYQKSSRGKHLRYIRSKGVNENRWHFFSRDGVTSEVKSLGDNLYSIDISSLLTYVSSNYIMLHHTKRHPADNTVLEHGKHTYWVKKDDDGKYRAWARYGVMLYYKEDFICLTPISTPAKFKIYIETDSDTATTGTAYLSM